MRLAGVVQYICTKYQQSWCVTRCYHFNLSFCLYQHTTCLSRGWSAISALVSVKVEFLNSWIEKGGPAIAIPSAEDMVACIYVILGVSVRGEPFSHKHSCVTFTFIVYILGKWYLSSYYIIYTEYIFMNITTSTLHNYTEVYTKSKFFMGSLKQQWREWESTTHDMNAAPPCIDIRRASSSSTFYSSYSWVWTTRQCVCARLCSLWSRLSCGSELP